MAEQIEKSGQVGQGASADRQERGSETHPQPKFRKAQPAPQFAGLTARAASAREPTGASIEGCPPRFAARTEPIRHARSVVQEAQSERHRRQDERAHGLHGALWTRWWGIIRLLRAHHWTKNGFCFAGLFFGGYYHDPGNWLKACVVFIYFCLASSTIYVWNDIFDLSLDQLHSRKRLRPLPSGQVQVGMARALALVLTASFFIGVSFVGRWAQACLLIYFFVNIAYVVRLKHVPLLDVSCITAGFVLRMLAGVYVLGDIPTTWITLCTMGLALLLATSKRRSELAGLRDGERAQRPVLLGYSVCFLDSLISSAATSTVLFYALFTVLSNKNPTLVLTVPVVYYAIMRYKSLVMISGQAEEPEMILLKDTGIQISIGLWLILYGAVLFFQPHWFR